ncbi:dTDP-4-amino-4,6-dideoxygalactose transaminase [Streptomyces iconiensis]|uniref:dTDP-4-amino-4,6-dideoxygalactose transaminase n=1 Tax=Streptomyces iconiensis TaxID=1384038 RepID=A0ABT7A6F3_9ACTN|nr:dTDP-4-amino-4,6-dideoxygalactose transaminase [Streptomyces iconiensis]MDJ1136891.1 dTDP-4-amino-4,6-dideoxygalactose transaminase [Streptomyces iconiensis]
MSIAYSKDSVVPFNVPYVSRNEADHIREALASGKVDGDGPFADRATTLLRKATGAGAALLAPSCTHALEIAALVLELRPGDEVIMPSFTFPSTANAFALRGAVPVFVDCRPDTLNLDERLLEPAITERTRAVVVMHYAGVSCEMDEIRRVASRHGLPIVEDNAHGLAASYHGSALGTFGVLATQSFHATKNIQCGEGGALLVNDPRLLDGAEIARDKGTNRCQYLRGRVEKYRWIELGSSYLLSEVLAAYLTAQLEDMPRIQERRHAVWNRYHDRLADWAERHRIARPAVPPGCEHPAHLYYLLLPDQPSRDAVLAHLNAHGVQATFHYQPLHTSSAGRKYGRSAPDGCPVTVSAADRLIRLPLFAGMTTAETDRVVDALLSYRPA